MSRIDSIIQGTKYIEEIVLQNEESRRREIDKNLRRSNERREIYKEAVDVS